MDTIGASHSAAAARQFSSGTMSFRLVEYSRIRPHPVQVRLQVCSGSSCSTMANFGLRRIRWAVMCRAILTVRARGKRMEGNSVGTRRSGGQTPRETDASSV